MTRQFNTYLLDEALVRHKETLEQERQTTLKQVQQWLETKGEHYKIYRAYIFGSLTRPHQFTQSSDIDLAVESIKPESLFLAMTALVEATGREVDFIELSKCPFAHRIRQEGILWTKMP
ncbi:MAG: nucleotidyltransferase domain-containing protein [Cyanobacteria bacterium P01_G01_bin.49]